MFVRRSKARSARDTFSELSPPSFVQRLVLDYVYTLPALHMIFVISITLVECAIIVMYFVGTEQDRGPVGWTRSLAKYPFPSAIAIPMGYFGIYAILSALSGIVLAADRFAETFRFSTIVGYGTGACMLCTWLMYSPSTGTTFLPPVFLRCWILFHHAKTALFSTTKISKPVQAIFVQMAFLLCIVITCVGMCQQSFSLESNSPQTFVDMFYFVIVTICTIGYGDVAPSSYLGRVIVICMIFVAMVLLPLLTNDVSEAVAYFEAQKGYNDTGNHIIIVGKFTLEDMQHIFRELLHPDRKFATVHLVFVSPEPYSEEVRTLTSSFELKSRVVLCVGTPVQIEELIRFAPRRADAVFFYSDVNMPASRGDFQIIQLAVLFKRTDPYLPQYFMLKHATHSHILEPNAFVVFDREALTYSIAGLSLKLPGVSTLILNIARPTTLLKSQTLEGDSLKHWPDLYEYGAQQSIFHVAPPEHFEGRSFSAVGLVLQLRAGVALVGLVRSTSCLVNPALVKILLTDRLLIIAPSWNYVSSVMSNFASLSGVGDAQPLAVAPVVKDEIVVPKRRTNCYPFKSHIVIVDVTSARCAPERCDEEEREADAHRAERLLTLASYFPKSQAFVLVSLTLPSDDEEAAWEAERRQPIFHLTGSPLDPEVLRMACITDAAGVLVVALDEGDMGHMIRSTLVAVQHLVLNIVGHRHVNVITILDDQDELSLLQPRGTAPENQAIENIQAFALGGGFSRSMLNTFVFRTYFNQYLPQTLEQLLQVGRMAMDDVTAFLAPGLVNSGKSIYSHLCRVLAGQLKVAVAVSRLLDETMADGDMTVKGRRCILTNPPCTMPLTKNDRVVYIQPELHVR